MVHEDGPAGHAGEGTIGAQRDAAQVVVIAHTAKHQLGAHGGFAGPRAADLTRRAVGVRAARRQASRASAMAAMRAVAGSGTTATAERGDSSGHCRHSDT